MRESPYAQTTIHLDYFIEQGQQGQYLFLSFPVGEDVESLSLRYEYPRHAADESEIGMGTFTSRPEINIVDLGLIAPDGSQVGASGSDKTEIFVSEASATPGYRPCPLVPGEWRILVGAYKIQPEGVTVSYVVTLTHKQRRLLKGDLHTHTLGSDGVVTAEELGWRAVRNGLDFVAITDHNQPVSRDALPKIPGLTLIPGLEWTHYQGHANFLGVDKPYDEPFLANTIEQVQARFASARSHGAFISANHPCDPVCPFLFDLNLLPFDCLEVWNGPMRGSNLQAIGLWHSMLVAGNKVPICGGSDYHRDSLLLFPGGPTVCVYAMSNSPDDLLLALKQGHAFITYSANGPTLEMTTGEAILGDSIEFSRVKQVEYVAYGFIAGDVVQVVTAHGNTILVKAETDGDMRGVYTMPAPGFARIEILRSFLPGLPLLPALVSNPIYFDA